MCRTFDPPPPTAPQIKIPGAEQYWPELLQTLWSLASSGNKNHLMSALEVFTGVPGIFADSISKYAQPIKDLLLNSLKHEDEDVRVAAAQAFSAFVPVVGRDIVRFLAELIPVVVEVRARRGGRRAAVAAGGFGGSDVGRLRRPSVPGSGQLGPHQPISPSFFPSAERAGHGAERLDHLLLGHPAVLYRDGRGPPQDDEALPPRHYRDHVCHYEQRGASPLLAAAPDASFAHFFFFFFAFSLPCPL